jgi:hypothetical protein
MNLISIVIEWGVNKVLRCLGSVPMNRCTRTTPGDARFRPLPDAALPSRIMNSTQSLFHLCRMVSKDEWETEFLG